MSTENHPPQVDLCALHAISTLGRGAKGVVFLVRSSTTKEALALKVISKSTVESKTKKGENDKNAYRRVWFEREVLASFQHPLLPSLRGFVETDKIVGFLMDWCPGGDLGCLRRRLTEQMFSDEYIRFYAAELVLALEHLHQQGIAYRDLKPENILIQESGHIMLVDFDLSVKLPPKPDPPLPSPTRPRKRRHRFLACLSPGSGGVSPEASDHSRSSPGASASGAHKSNSFVGTEDYVAPEIIRGNGHDCAVDWWSLGVVLYEMLYGKTPFRGQNRKETFYRVLNMEAPLVGERTALRDLIGRLLEKDGERRIGCEEIKAHVFFRGVDWEEILTVARTPFIPAGVDWKEGKQGIDVEKFVDEVFGEDDGIKKDDFSVF